MKSLGIAPAEFAPSQFRILDQGQGWVSSGMRVGTFARRKSQARRSISAVSGEGEVAPGRVVTSRNVVRSPEKGRTVSIRITERAEVAAFREKMERPENKAIYRRRGEVAEFPNAWIKDKLGLRKFRVRGLKKAGSELLWACLTYNIMQWIRLKWRQQLAIA